MSFIFSMKCEMKLPAEIWAKRGFRDLRKDIRYEMLWGRRI